MFSVIVCESKSVKNEYSKGQVASSLTQSHADAVMARHSVVTGNTAAVGSLKMQKFKVSLTDTDCF